MDDKGAFKLDEDKLVIRTPGSIKDLDRVQTVEPASPVGDIFEMPSKPKAPVYFMDDDFYHHIQQPVPANQTIEEQPEPVEAPEPEPQELP